MKTWPLCALTLAAVSFFPHLALAQAPAGVARIDSDTYFDTSNASWDYHSQQNNFDQYPSEPSNSWWQGPGINSSNHAGLLGKAYIRTAYLYNGMDDRSTFVVDDGLDGADVELNLPLPGITFDNIGTDFFAKYEYRSFPGTVRSSGIQFEREGEYTVLGARIFAFPDSRFRPYVSLGAGFSQITTTGNGVSTESDDNGFVTNLGIEADLASNASIRGDFDVDRDELDDSTFEGTVVLWLNENIFFRGGGVIPLNDGFDPGVTIGGGVAFR